MVRQVISTASSQVESRRAKSGCDGQSGRARSDRPMTPKKLRAAQSRCAPMFFYCTLHPFWTRPYESRHPPQKKKSEKPKKNQVLPFFSPTEFGFSGRTHNNFVWPRSRRMVTGSMSTAFKPVGSHESCRRAFDHIEPSQAKSDRDMSCRAHKGHVESRQSGDRRLQTLRARKSVRHLCFFIAFLHPRCKSVTKRHPVKNRKTKTKVHGFFRPSGFFLGHVGRGTLGA